MVSSYPCIGVESWSVEAGIMTKVRSNVASKTRSGSSRSIGFSVGASIVAIGIVYGDLGTSPVYMMKAALGGQGGIRSASDDFILGALSLVIWTLTLLATVKYVLIAMNADNRGEGGIFALYQLVRRHGRWLVFPAMLGGAAFLADSMLTPAVSVTSAVEGLMTIPSISGLLTPSMVTGLAVFIVITLFLSQRIGTNRIGSLFGPVMTLWFVFLTMVAIPSVIRNPSVLLAFDPIRGVSFLLSGENRAGFALLGSVFLCVTGAEALYSDMAHVGKWNIYATWPFIKIAIIVNYLGQGAWLMSSRNDPSLDRINDLNPFFQMMPGGLRPFAVLFAVAAGVIASQALISGSFSIVSEAISLNWMPHLKVSYPSSTKTQIYIPAVNLVLGAGTVIAIVLFKNSSGMEGAYGLSLSVAMVATTVLLAAWIRFEARGLNAVGHAVGSVVMLVFFGLICTVFMLSSLMKFFHGGWYTALMTMLILGIMVSWAIGTQVERRYRRKIKFEGLAPDVRRLSQDESIPLTADNLIWLSPIRAADAIDEDVERSIFGNDPKRARAYWIVSIAIMDAPYGCEWSCRPYGDGTLFRVRIRLGYKMPQNVRPMLRHIMETMVNTGEMKPQPNRYPGHGDDTPSVGSVKYVLIMKSLSPDSRLDFVSSLAIKVKYTVRALAGSPLDWFGLKWSAPIVERTPLAVRGPQDGKDIPMKRVRFRGQKLDKTAMRELKEEKARSAELMNE